MKFPFKYTLKGLLLSGKNREIARINYEMPEGYDKEIALLDLEFPTQEMKKLPEYQLQALDIKRKYDKIDDFEKEMSVCQILNKNKSEVDKKLEELEVKRKFKRIEEVDYFKEKNDLLGKPWVAIHTDYNEDSNPDNMIVEVVYNKTFIKNLTRQGYVGDTEEELVEHWLAFYMASNFDLDGLYDMMEDEEDPKVKKKYLTRQKLDDNSSIIIS